MNISESTLENMAAAGSPKPTRRLRYLGTFRVHDAGDFHRSPPLPVPLCEATVRSGRKRVRRLADVARVPVGLENLAFAFGPQDMCHQGVFLKHLLGRVDGFLLLDLHNVYCQLCDVAALTDSVSIGTTVSRGANNQLGMSAPNELAVGAA